MPHNFVALQTEVAETRVEKYMGRNHLVVPIIALVEQVLHSSTSSTPELALSEEFGKLPTGWNGRPVVVNHPEMNGKKVSANIPQVLETELIGQVFNSKFEDNKLKMEAYIDLERAEELGGHIWETVQKLQNNEMTEISTGLFADVEKKEGEFAGKKFNGIWRNIVPDHLAILSESIGACSIEDGCGAPRLNSDGAACQCEKCVKAQAKPPEEKHPFKFFSWQEFINNRKMKGDKNKRTVIQAALTAKFGGEAYLESVFDNTVVFSTYSGYFETEYSLNDDSSVKFGDKANAVIPQVSFIPMKVNSDGSLSMDKEKFVTQLIDSESNDFSADDKTWLLALNEDQLAKFESLAEDKKGKDEKKETTDEDEKDMKKNEEKVEEDPMAFLSKAPSNVQDFFNEGIRLQSEKRDNLVASIKANKANKFTDTELKNMSTQGLENLAALAKQDDYSARGGPRSQLVPESNAPASMPMVFGKKTA